MQAFRGTTPSRSSFSCSSSRPWRTVRRRLARLQRRGADARLGHLLLRPLRVLVLLRPGDARGTGNRSTCSSCSSSSRPSGSSSAAPTSRRGPTTKVSSPTRNSLSGPTPRSARRVGRGRWLADDDLLQLALDRHGDAVRRKLVRPVPHRLAGVLERAGRARQPATSWTGYLTNADFWEATLENWQSEFLAVGSMAAFTVYLRQRGSPESKPVGAPHDQTGTSG